MFNHRHTTVTPLSNLCPSTVAPLSHHRHTSVTRLLQGIYDPNGIYSTFSTEFPLLDGRREEVAGGIFRPVPQWTPVPNEAEVSHASWLHDGYTTVT